MSNFIDKAKEQAEELVEKAKPYADKARVQAQDLVEKAKPYADKARVQAQDLVEKARPIAASAVERVGDGIDKVTGGRYTDKIDGMSDKVEGALRGETGAARPAGTTAEAPSTGNVTSPGDVTEAGADDVLPTIEQKTDEAANEITDDPPAAQA